MGGVIAALVSAQFWAGVIVGAMGALGIAAAVAMVMADLEQPQRRRKRDARGRWK